MSSEVRCVTVQIKRPKGDDPGQVAHGAYIIEGDKLTMTTPRGKPERDLEGRTYTHRLADKDNPQAIAAVLTRQLRGALKGKSAPVSGFDKRIKLGGSRHGFVPCTCRLLIQNGQNKQNIKTETVAIDPSLLTSALNPKAF